MSAANLSTFLRRLSDTVAAGALNDLSDRQLVERALAGHDEAIFRAIIHRHGAMVYRVCCRVLRHDQDVEDAFQNTFLILAQNLASLRRHASLASWLHGVAHRVALNARGRAATRLRHEQRAGMRTQEPAAAAPVEDLTWKEVRAVLDDELGRLPERWRLPLILCYLEGRTQDEAAKQLGWSKNTLRSRLEEARNALGRRLTERGVVWSVVLSAALLSDCLASTAPSPALVASAVRAAARAGDQPAVEVASATAILTNGGSRTMSLTKLKIGSAVLLLAGFLGVITAGFSSLGLASGSFEGTPPADKTNAVVLALPAPKAAAPVPKAEPRKEVIVVTRVSRDKPAEVLDPAGKSIGELKLGSVSNAWTPRLSPDGKRVAVLTQIDPEVGTATNWLSYALYVVDLNAKSPDPDNLLMMHVRCPGIAWSADGKKLYVSSIPRDKLRVAENVDQVVPVQTRVYDPETGKDSATDIPEGHAVMDMAPDGKSVLTTVRVWDRDAERLTNHIVPLDTFKPVQLGKEGLSEPRFSPDGKLVIGVRRALSRSANQGLFVFDLAKKQETEVALPKEFKGTPLERACWSPDGKRILFHWQDRGPPAGPGGPPGGAEMGPTSRGVSVAGIDGSNVKLIVSIDSGPSETITGLDWK
jgi:RNA polymerase sigma factor (sigma-70 family)